MWALADVDAIGRELRGKRIGHEGVVRSRAEHQGFPTAAGDGDKRALATGDIATEGDFLDVSIGTEDEVVDRTAFNEDVGVIGLEPVEVVDWPLAGEQVIDLTLDCEMATADGEGLSRFPDEAKVAGFFREGLEVERVDEFDHARVSFRGGSGSECREKNQGKDDDRKPSHGSKSRGAGPGFGRNCEGMRRF